MAAAERSLGRRECAIFHDISYGNHGFSATVSLRQERTSQIK